MKSLIKTPSIEDLIKEYDDQFIFMINLNIITKDEYEKYKSFYVFKALATHYIPSLLQENLPYLKVDSHL